MGTPVWHVEEADPGDLGRVSATLANAFATDPILRWLIPNRPGRDARVRRLFALELERYGFSSGRVLTTDDVRGASLELPPDKWRMPSSMGLSDAIGWLRVFGLRLPRASRTQQQFDHGHLQEPHYYVRYVGVAARSQGQGLGSALLRPTLDRCDRERLPAYLEASSKGSAALYERLGFVHLGEQRLPDGPPFWPMRRPAAGE
jgi:GNAT superfamily N-acetyltransferase